MVSATAKEDHISSRGLFMGNCSGYMMEVMQFDEIGGVHMMLLNSAKNKVVKRSGQAMKFLYLPTCALGLMLLDRLRCNSDVMTILINLVNSEADMAKVSYHMFERGVSVQPPTLLAENGWDMMYHQTHEEPRKKDNGQGC